MKTQFSVEEEEMTAEWEGECVGAEAAKRPPEGRGVAGRPRKGFGARKQSTVPLD
jgi:hypothetical protein